MFLKKGIRGLMSQETICIFDDFFLLSISGVAYSKHMVQIYSYHGGDDLRNHLEVCLSLSHTRIAFGDYHC